MEIRTGIAAAIHGKLSRGKENYTKDLQQARRTVTISRI